MVVALKPLHDAATIKRVVVATYQSVSGAGKAGMDELFEQSRNIFVGDGAEPAKFTKQIAFNVIPHIDDFLDDGSTKEEWKMVVETKKILDPKIKVTATCVRVPVFVGHSEAINIEFEKRDFGAKRRRRILREAPGIMLVDKREDGGYVTPVECVGEYATYVSRVREDPTVDNGLALWCVSDNLRKGAALNAVQIAELLGRRHLEEGRLRRVIAAKGWLSQLLCSSGAFAPPTLRCPMSSSGRIISPSRPAPPACRIFLDQLRDIVAAGRTPSIAPMPWPEPQMSRQALALEPSPVPKSIVLMSPSGRLAGSRPASSIDS